MSSTEVAEAIVETPEPAEEQRFVRTAELELSPDGDGRTLDALIVPYNHPATVSDPPDHVPYREMFMPGAFERQLAAPDRVKILLNFEHEQGIHGVVGHGVALRDQPDGLHGSFVLLRTQVGDTALELVRAGETKGLSIEFRSQPAWSRTVDGVRQRVKAIVDKVALCRFPAYPAAQILAVRTEPAEPVWTPDPDVDMLLARQGIQPLQMRAVTSKPWSGSPARFSDEQYAKSALFCRPGDGPPKERCSLPVLEPNGDLNANALGAAAAALAGARGGVANTTAGQKASAARKLLRLYGQAGMTAPDSLKTLARG
jgi:HK97 family phage prohead protease